MIAAERNVNYMPATFKFDKLEGIIRLRKNLEWDLERSRLTAEAYATPVVCHLKTGLPWPL